MPPFGAIVVVKADLISINKLRVDAARVLEEEPWHRGQMTSDDKDVIVDFIAYTSAGASEIAGLAPTLVAAVTSGFAVLREVTNWVPPTIAYISAMILILIIIVKMLSGVTYYAIADKGIELVKKGRLFLEKGITLNRQEISSKVIYLINGALIVLAVSVYMTHPTLGP